MKTVVGLWIDHRGTVIAYIRSAAAAQSDGPGEATGALAQRLEIDNVTGEGAGVRGKGVEQRAAPVGQSNQE